MGSDFNVKAGSLLPTLKIKLRNSQGVPVDLSSLSSSEIRIQLESGGPTITRTPSVFGSPTEGILEYNWQVTDFSGATPSLVAGTYNLEIHLNFAAGGPMIVPSVGTATLTVQPSISV